MKGRLDPSVEVAAEEGKTEEVLLRGQGEDEGDHCQVETPHPKRS